MNNSGPPDDPGSCEYIHTWRPRWMIELQIQFYILIWKLHYAGIADKIGLRVRSVCDWLMGVK